MNDSAPKRIFSLGVFATAPALLLSPSCASKTRFTEQEARPPLDRLRITYHGSRAVEVFATLQSNALLGDVVDVALFDGFRPTMSLVEAERAHGSIDGSTLDEVWTSSTWSFFDRPEGRVGVMLVQTSEDSAVWQVVGRPKERAVHEVIRDREAYRQLKAFLPSAGESRTRIRIRSATGIGVSVLVSASGVDAMVLTGGEASEPHAT